MAIIGLGSLSFVLKNKKDATPIHQSHTANGFTTIRFFTPNVCFGCLMNGELTTYAPRDSKKLSVFMPANQFDLWDRAGCKDQLISDVDDGGK